MLAWQAQGLSGQVPNSANPSHSDVLAYSVNGTSSQSISIDQASCQSVLSLMQRFPRNGSSSITWAISCAKTSRSDPSGPRTFFRFVRKRVLSQGCHIPPTRFSPSFFMRRFAGTHSSYASMGKIEFASGSSMSRSNPATLNALRDVRSFGEIDVRSTREASPCEALRPPWQAVASCAHIGSVRAGICSALYAIASNSQNTHS